MNRDDFFAGAVIVSLAVLVLLGAAAFDAPRSDSGLYGSKESELESAVKIRIVLEFEAPAAAAMAVFARADAAHSVHAPAMKRHFRFALTAPPPSNDMPYAD
jgi:hypothetical protein